MSNIIKNPVINYNQENAIYIDIKETYKKKEPIKIDNNSAEIINQNIITKAKQDADRIISEAEKKAAQVLKNANKDAIILKSQIEEEVRKKSYEEGFHKGSEESEKIINQANKELENAIKEKEEIINEIEPQMVELIIDISKKILGDIAKTNHQYISYLIKKGFSKVKEEGNKVIIRLSPEDYPSIMESKDELFEELGINSTIEIIKDSSLSFSHCIIETEFGNIDCSLDVQFEGLKKELLLILNS